MANPIRLRPARADEFSVLVAIDDDATQLYSTAGIHFELTDRHPFVIAEQDRWARSLEAGTVFLAEDPSANEAIGMAVLGVVDGEPYLDQLSVRTSAMRRGVGKRLLEQAIRWAEPSGLWLSTYSHLTWNRPFYERKGFRLATEATWGPELCAIMEQQRASLPYPEQRVVLYRPFDAPSQNSQSF